MGHKNAAQRKVAREAAASQVDKDLATPEASAASNSITALSTVFDQAMTVSNVQLAAQNPNVQSAFHTAQHLARQVPSDDFIKASLQAEEPSIYRATVAGAILATADETRQLTHDAIVNDLSETLREDAMTTEMQFRNMNTRVAAIESQVSSLVAQKSVIEQENADLKVTNAQLRAELDQIKGFLGLTTQQMVIC